MDAAAMSAVVTAETLTAVVAAAMPVEFLPEVVVATVGPFSRTER